MATGLTDGSHCAECGKTIKEQTEIPMLAHTETVDKGYGATCEKVGLTDGSHCVECGKIITAQTEIAKLPHVEIVDKGYESTCKEQGLSDGTHCLDCGAVIEKQTALPLKAHTVVIDVAVAPSCDQTGLSQGSHCSECGTIIVEQQVLVSTHDYGTVQFIYTDGAISEIIVPCKKCDEYKTVTGLYAEYVGNDIYVGNYATKSNIKAYLIVDYVEKIAVTDFSVGSLRIQKCGANYIEVTYYDFETTVVVDGYINETSYSYFTYTISKEQVTITAYTGAETAVRIPNTIEGYPVVAIAKNAFKDNLTIKSVMLGDNIQTLAENVFYGCTLLETIVLNDGLTKIGYNAFANTAITEMIIPDSVTTISNNGSTTTNYSIFEGCQKLKRVVVGDGLTTLTACLFDGLDSLTEVVIGKNITVIGQYAFGACTSLVDIVIPNSVTEINGYAFKDCVSLKNITWSNNLTTIYRDAFYNCTSLTKVQLPNSLKTIYYNAFMNCSLLDTVILNEGLTTIYYNAFAGTAITEMIIPDSVTSISNNGDSDTNYSIFEGCQKLRKVVLGSGLTTLTSCLFDDLQALEEVVIGKNVTVIGTYAFDGCTALTDIVIPDSVKEINGYSFRGCVSLKNITWSNNLTTIYCDAFNGCTSLERVQLPNSLKEINANAFMNCTLLKSVILNEGLTSIYYNAFAYTAITELIIPDSVTAITNYYPGYGERNTSIIEGCQKLKKVVLGSGLTTVTECLFQNLQALEEVVIGENVTTIGIYSFNGCSALESIVIPNSVTLISYDSFANCISLKNITWGNSLAEIGSSSFYGCTSLTKVQLPNSVKTIYHSAFMNCASLETIILNEGLTTIQYNAFANTAITELIIPDSVTAITNYYPGYGERNTSIIEDCQKLRRVVLGSGLTTVTECLFQNLQALEEVVFGDNITTISAYAFDGCSSLESIVIPDCVTQINNYAFSGTGLKNIKIPENVHTIGNYAFANCLKLEYLLFEGTALKSVGSYVTNSCPSARRIYYKGTIAEWNAISINANNSAPFNQIPYIYSQYQPATEGNYWHYASNGEPIVWDISLSEYKVYAMSNAYTGVMGSSLLSCSTAYLNEMEDDTWFMAQKVIYETATVVSEITAIAENQMTKEQLYIIVLLDMLGYNYADSNEVPEAVTSLGEWTNFISYSVASVEMVLDKEAFGLLYDAVGTGTEMVMAWLNVNRENEENAMNLLGFAMQSQNSINILNSISQTTSNKYLRSATTKVIDVIEKALDGMVYTVVQGNEIIQGVADFASIAINLIWGKVCSLYLPLQVAQWVAKGLVIGLDLFCNTGVSVDAYYKLEVTSVIETALRNQILALNGDYLRRENLVESALLYGVINFYSSAITKGYEYTLSYLDSVEKDSSYILESYEHNKIAFKQFEAEIENTYYSLYGY